MIRLKNFRMTFAEKLKKLHTGRNWNQADVARAVGVSEGSVSNWLQGRGRPNLETGLLLARTFGVPLEYLADDAMEEPPPGLGPWAKVLEYAQRLTPEDALDRLMMKWGVRPGDPTWDDRFGREGNNGAN